LSPRPRRVVDDHPAGATIVIHHDPEHPWEAALLVGVTAVAPAQPILGMILVVAAAGVLVGSRARQSTDIGS
jgi:hypothetical protein